MRYLYALVLGIGLCGVPAIGRAAPAADRTSQSAAAVPAPAPATQSHRPDGPSAGSNGRAADNTDMARYAQRETQSGKALDYRGGDTLVIGSTAVVVILAVVLIVVLL